MFIAKDLWFLCTNPALANLLDVCLAENDASPCIDKFWIGYHWLFLFLTASCLESLSRNLQNLCIQMQHSFI